MTEIFTDRVRRIIAQIPCGKVSNYGIIARRAGSASGARQVARILHSSSAKYNLPWHRVVNRKGQISLAPGRGFERQKKLLEEENVFLDGNNTIDLQKHLWLGNDFDLYGDCE